MPRHVVATLLIGIFVAAALIGVYQTPVSSHLGAWVSNLYEDTALAVSTDLFLPLQYAVIIFFAYGATWVAVDTTSAGGRLLVALLAIFAVVALSPTLAIYGNLFEPVTGAAAIALGTLAGSLYAKSEPGKRRHLLRALLHRRANPSLIRRLTDAKHPLPLDSITRPSAAFTCRIINHQELAAALSAEKMAEMTKRFHTLVRSHILVCGGVLDTDSPDCARSYFGLIPSPEELPNLLPAAKLKLTPPTPLSKKANSKPNRKRGKSAPPPGAGEGGQRPPAPAADPEKVAHTGDETILNDSPAEARDWSKDLSAKAIEACKTALELAPHLHNLSRECETETGHRLVSGIGIECGTVTSCLIDEGEGQRLGAVGSIADFSQRLSAANGIYGSDILIGPTAFNSAKNAVEVRPLEMLYNAASKQLDEIYELVDEKGLLSEADTVRRQAFWEGVVLFRQKDPDGALEKFTQAKGGRRHDPPLAYFIGKTKTLKEELKSRTSNSETVPAHARDTASF